MQALSYTSPHKLLFLPKFTDRDGQQDTGSQDFGVLHGQHFYKRSYLVRSNIFPAFKILLGSKAFLISRISRRLASLKTVSR